MTTTTRVEAFRIALTAFKQALEYIGAHQAEFEQNKARYAKIKANFSLKYEKPLDEAWKALSKEEKLGCSTLKYLDPGLCDQKEFEEAQRIAKMFNGKIVSVEDNA